MRADRLLALLMLLQARGRLTAAQLAQSWKFPSGRSTVT
jgi:predicted DNA-binding transcriptional regulator YafY